MVAVKHLTLSLNSLVLKYRKKVKDSSLGGGLEVEIGPNRALTLVRATIVCCGLPGDKYI